MDEVLIFRLLIIASVIWVFVLAFPFRRFGVSEARAKVIKIASASFVLAIAVRLFVVAL